ncbi:MAG: ROK family protein [Planctomycetes bacterium]|nr:ROK family protein [Planctomycetota bacterium]
MPDRTYLASLADAKKPLFVGIDVGGTNIKLGLVDRVGRTVGYHSIPTEVKRGPEDAVVRMAVGFEHLLEQSGAAKGDVVRIGVATPTADIDRGELAEPGNLPEWWHFPIRRRVSEACGLPVRYANDANAAAYGEFWSGAGADFHSMVMLTLGTGVGGGIIVGDQLIEGAHSYGGECGHMIIDPSDDARVDSFDKKGSLEAYCGAYAIVGRTNEALEAGRKSSLAAVRSAGQEISPLEIAKAAEAGDELAREIVMDTARYLSLGIVSLIHTIDPGSVVIGGGVNFGGAGHPLGEEFLQHIRDEVRPRLLAPLQDPLHIDFAQLGGDAGYIGAAGLACLEHRQEK